LTRKELVNIHTSILKLQKSMDQDTESLQQKARAAELDRKIEETARLLASLLFQEIQRLGEVIDQHSASVQDLEMEANNMKIKQASWEEDLKELRGQLDSHKSRHQSNEDWLEISDLTSRLYSLQKSHQSITQQLQLLKDLEQEAKDISSSRAADAHEIEGLRDEIHAKEQEARELLMHAQDSPRFVDATNIILTHPAPCLGDTAGYWKFPT
jgi:chromosome segregation ATPase